MKLFSASIVDTIDTFLHAGYVSAYPRPLETWAYKPGTEYAGSNGELNLTEALRLEETPGADGGLDAAYAGLADIGSNEHALILGTITLTGLIIWALVRKGKTTRPRRALDVALVVLFAVAPMAHCGTYTTGDSLIDQFNDTEDTETTTDPPEEPETEPPSKHLPSDPPWDNLTLQNYDNPQDATLAILYGIIGPALSNLGQPAVSLPNIQNEVGLPTESPTGGMAYALQSYGLDGWGREMRLEPYSTGKQSVTSAGPDGQFDNTDDIVADVRITNNNNWGVHRNAFYLVEQNSEVKAVYHRWNGTMYQTNNGVEATEITGGILFDLFTPLNLSDEQNCALMTAYNSHTAGESEKPIVLQYWDAH